MLKVEVDAKDLLESLGRVYSRSAAKASVRAANRTLTTLRAITLRILMEKLSMKRKDLVSRVSFYRATAKDPTAALIIRGSGMPLAKASARQVKVQSTRGRRLGVTVVQNGTRALVPGGFLVAMKSGHQGIFARVGDSRLPIRQLFSDGLSDILKKDPRFESQVLSQGTEIFLKNFEQDYAYFVARDGEG
jgi:hypothetical protein